VTLPPGRLRLATRPKCTWIARGQKNNGERVGCRLGSQPRGGGRRPYDRHLPTYQIGRHCGQSVVSTFGPLVLNPDVLVLDIAGVVQSLAECRHDPRIRRGRETAEDPDHRHRRLLRTGGEWPARRRTAEKGDELAPLHSINSSARASSVGGTSRPSAFAVLRLITSSYFVGACTGRSAGFSPLRMRST
jgi:hypothetical protein